MTPGWWGGGNLRRLHALGGEDVETGERRSAHPLSIGIVPGPRNGDTAIDDTATVVHAVRHGHAGGEGKSARGRDVVDGVTWRHVGGVLGASNGGGAAVWGGGASQRVRTWVVIRRGIWRSTH